MYTFPPYKHSLNLLHDPLKPLFQPERGFPRTALDLPRPVFDVEKRKRLRDFIRALRLRLEKKRVSLWYGCTVLGDLYSGQTVVYSGQSANSAYVMYL